MTGNKTLASPRSRLRGDHWAAFDRLPKQIRWALCDANVEWSACDEAANLRKLRKAGVEKDAAIDWIVSRFPVAEAKELDSFKHRWPSRCGPYPHIAAGATIMRYNEREIVAARRRTACTNNPYGR